MNQNSACLPHRRRVRSMLPCRLLRTVRGKGKYYVVFGPLRWGGLAAMGAGALFIVYSLLSFAVGKGDEPGPLDVLAILAYVLEVVGLLGFHALQGSNYGRIGRAGLYTTIGAIVLWEFLILTGLLGSDVGLGWLVAVGVLGTLVGLVLYGAATLQARVLPRWCGILFILLMPGT